MSVWYSRLVLDSAGFPDDGPGPIAYRKSHVIPRPDDPRKGSLDTAHIPSFLTRDGYDDGDTECGLAWWSYLRLSLATDVPDEDTVILDVVQVDALIADLTAWRAGVKEELT